jgi:hypothetical protein
MERATVAKRSCGVRDNVLECGHALPPLKAIFSSYYSFLEFDRVRYRADEQSLQTFTGERIAVTGNQPNRSGWVSFRGHFLSATGIAVISHHYHRDYRDISSLIGQFMTCTLLLQSLILPHFQAAKK